MSSPICLIFKCYLEVMLISRKERNKELITMYNKQKILKLWFFKFRYSYTNEEWAVN